MMPSRRATKVNTTRKKTRGRPSIPFLHETILRHASDLFAKKDFARVSVDEIAARSEVGKGSVYRQFGSKEELYASVVIEGFKHLQKEIRSALCGLTSTRDEIETVVQHTLRYFWTRRQFFALLRDPAAIPASLERSFFKQRQELSKMIDVILTEGIAAGAIRPDVDTRIVAESLLGMLRGISRYCREYTTPENASKAAVSVFFDGCASKS